MRVIAAIQIKILPPASNEQIRMDVPENLSPVHHVHVVVMRQFVDVVKIRFFRLSPQGWVRKMIHRHKGVGGLIKSQKPPEPSGF